MENNEVLECVETKSKLDLCNDLIKELVGLLEYEEAMTVDTRSQQRMASKLRELGLWPSE
jgi:hypothetical protein